MTAWKTATYWGIFLFLAAFYWVFEREPVAAPKQQASRVTFLPVFADEVAAVTLERSGKRIRCEREKKRWKVIEPAAAAVPGDLVAALVSTLTDKQEAEVVEATPSAERLAEFGLDAAATRLVVETEAGRTFAVQVGRRNPTRTAVYARTEDAPRIMLVGINVEYYSDLLYQAAFPATQAAAPGTQN